MKDIIKEWKEIEPETLDHLVTVIMCMVDEDTGELRDKHFGEVKDYIENFIKYRSQFVRDIFKDSKKVWISKDGDKIDNMSFFNTKKEAERFQRMTKCRDMVEKGLLVLEK
jgi:hypothetical protein